MSYGRLFRDIIEAYNIDFEQISHWTMAQLYYAVVDKKRIPSKLGRPGTVTMSYEEAMASGVFRGQPNPQMDVMRSVQESLMSMIPQEKKSTKAEDVTGKKKKRR